MWQPATYPDNVGMTSDPPTPRVTLLTEIAALVTPATRPILVGIDGLDGAGKSWFADELAQVLASRTHDLSIVRSSVDYFHHEQTYRHALGRTAETVWNRSFDYRTMRCELLDPWLRGAGSSYRFAWRDLTTDALVDTPAQRVPERGMLLVDGVFIQRPELVDVWDVTIFVDVPFAVSAARMARRDGSTPDPDAPEHRRYADAQRHYLAACDPAGRADIVVDNTDLERPVLTHPTAHPTTRSAADSEGGVPPGWQADGEWWARTVRVRAGDTDLVTSVDRLTPPE